MTKAAGRAIATAILAALLGAAWAAVLYAWHPALAVEFDRDMPRNVSGIFPSERDDRAHLTFAWTAQDAVLRLPGLDRRVEWHLRARIRGARPVSSENPILTVLADGATVSTTPTQPDFRDVDVVIPRRPTRRGLVVEFHSSKTLVPGAGDPRALGIMIDRLTLSPAGAVLLPRPALAAIAFSSAAMGAAIALLGITAGSAIGGAVLLSAGDAAIVTRGFAPFSDYPSAVSALGLWIAAALAIAAVLLRFLRREPLRNTARFAAAFSAAALFLKLLILLHPNMPVGDAMFHAHRFQGVLAGHLYFTSIAPGGYLFPYAPGLYVFSALFAGFVHRGAADMTLLRLVTGSADAVAAVLLYRAIALTWSDRLAGAIAVALYHLTPLDFGVLTTGNLTNAFAQSISVSALVVMSSAALRRERVAMTALLAFALFAAYVSHTSTFAILLPATVLIVLLFLLRGGPALRSPAAAVAIATLVAAALATILYYAHFMDTYRTQLARIGHETASVAPGPGGHTIVDRARLVPYSLRIYFGIPLLALFVLGTWQLWTRRAADRLTLAVAGWLLACVLFLVIGVLTPVDMRYYLAAIPALVIVAALGGSAAWRDGISWRAVALVLLLAATLVGVRNWWTALA
jgi:hypothetical protein